MVLALCCGLLLGFPVAFTLGGIAVIFSLTGWALDLFDLILLQALPSRILQIMKNGLLVAVPLFIYMGVILERSKIAEDLLGTMAQLFGALRGGVGLSVILVGTLIAAATGIVGATVTAMGLLSLPTMLRAGYDPRLASGIVCAAGTLGQIIPPSISIIVIGSVLTNVYAQAQYDSGAVLVEPLSVVDLFAGALLPGLVLVGLYLLWQAITALRRPDFCPAYYDESVSLREAMVRGVKLLVPPVALIIAVLGSILAGAATPAEAASVGAVGAMAIAAAGRRLSLDTVRESVQVTARMSCLIFSVLIGATIFTLTFRGFGGDDLVANILTGLPGGLFTSMLLVMVVMFLLGFILDWVEIVYIVVPLVTAPLIALGADPVWLGIMMAINIQTSFLTPPFGWALFYLRGVAPEAISTVDIYRGVGPFIAIQILGLAIVAGFPSIATWLPEQMFR